MKITLKPEDITTVYTDPLNCPMANALKKALNVKTICTAHVDVRAEEGGVKIGRLDPPFTIRIYKQLRSREIEEFTTTYTPV